ncbi:hypothetical protein SAMN04487944_102240 [Gracilibacillus ureilyticus]|uniref:Prenyltransferase and squalene oxidase repeat-containing protein n=1 Tax=Gracilibacillus ureilyticus TaxID=531814 RepID=A0A1H9MYN2_9BACI|nr:hypothetical protein [Gracilibacillus ureilyticus]SER28768.1 hypothetical protein SAMN04487944_102240 [Gracilibacillus ureilyticus]
MGWKDESLAQLDELYNGMFNWLGDQYDSVTGGFYYAKSSVNNDSFSPDIESTAQGLNILIRHQLKEKMPETVKQQMINFFQLKQDKETGYFYDEHPAMKKDEVMVHRAMAYSINSLKRLGADPLYALPVSLNVAPSYTESLEAYRGKWESIDLRNSWRGCDLLASSTVYIRQMSPEKQADYVKACAEYLAEIQDIETGLWGEGSLYVRISGTFKLHTFYRSFQIPMPNQDKIYQSILYCLRNEEAVDMCYIRNPIDLLSYLALEVPDEELKEITEITIRNMARLKREDGGFSRELEHSPQAPNVAQVKGDEFYPDMPAPVPLGLGLYEGDMNATTQATLIRKQLYHLLEYEPGKLIEADQFWGKCGEQLEQKEV